MIFIVSEKKEDKTSQPGFNNNLFISDGFFDLKHLKIFQERTLSFRALSFQGICCSHTENEHICIQESSL